MGQHLPSTMCVFYIAETKYSQYKGVKVKYVRCRISFYFPGFNRFSWMFSSQFKSLGSQVRTCPNFWDWSLTPSPSHKSTAPLKINHNITFSIFRYLFKNNLQSLWLHGKGACWENFFFFKFLNLLSLCSLRLAFFPHFLPIFAFLPHFLLLLLHSVTPHLFPSLLSLPHTHPPPLRWRWRRSCRPAGSCQPPAWTHRSRRSPWQRRCRLSSGLESRSRRRPSQPRSPPAPTRTSEQKVSRRER